jgi:acetyl esterase
MRGDAVNQPDMPLHPKVHALLTAQRLSGAPPLQTLSPDRARADLRAQAPAVSGPLAEVARITDRALPTPAGLVPVRLYTPLGAGRFAGVVYFHGGGFVIGDLDTHDPLCRQIASRLGAVVCAVDYRLAPEHPFPAAPDDAIAATRWFMTHAAELGADPGRVFVMGDSAGGTLATVAAIALREQRIPRLRGQVLIYPITDHVDVGTESYAHFADGYGLTRDGMRWFMRHYLRDPGDATDPRVCPVRAPNLRNLPPAFVMTAEYDVLRDEGERYAQRLSEDGNDVTAERADGLHHGFIRLFGILEESGQWLDRIRVWTERV